MVNRFADYVNSFMHTAQLFMINNPNITITSQGPELDWITNAILQYVKK
jgi:hypothetical protein